MLEDHESSASRAAQLAVERSTQGNVYTASAVRLGEGTDTEHTSRIQAVRLDLDFKRGHSEESRLAQVGAYSPDCVVHSGGGIQPWWWFLPVGPERFAEVKALMTRLGRRFDSDPTADIARIMRVPGTINYKYVHRPLVRLLSLSDKRWRTFEQTSDLFGDDPDEYTVSDSPGVDDDTIYAGVGEGMRNVALFSWAQRRRNMGLPVREALALALGINRQYFHPSLDEDEVRKTINSAYGWSEWEGVQHAEVVDESRTWWRLDDILDHEEGEVDWLSPGLFERGDIVFMPHAVKGGKTTILLNFALRMAGGISDGVVQPKQAYRVALAQAAGEMKPRKIRDWVRRASKAMDLKSIAFTLIIEPSRDKLYAELMEKGSEFDLVIIDTLSRMFPDVDDRDTRTVSKEMDRVRALRTRWPHAVWAFAVQVGKNSLQFSGTDQEAFTIRGNSAIAEAYDTLIAIRVPDDSVVDDQFNKLNREIFISGRSAGDYRRPFRTLYDTATGLIHYERAISPAEITKQVKSAKKQGATQALAQLFKERKTDNLMGSEIKAVLGTRYSMTTLRSAFDDRLSGAREKQGRDSVWTIGSVSVVEDDE